MVSKAPRLQGGARVGEESVLGSEIAWVTLVMSGRAHVEAWCLLLECPANGVKQAFLPQSPPRSSLERSANAARSEELSLRVAG